MEQPQATIIYAGYGQEGKQTPNLLDIKKNATMGLKLLAEKVTERLASAELENPGDYCYKKLAMAIGHHNEPVKFKQTVMLNCPMCNRSQNITQNEITYQGKWKKKVNDFFQKHFTYTPFKNLNGVLTIHGEVTCTFNKLHKFFIIKNEIKPAGNKNEHSQMVTRVG